MNRTVNNYTNQKEGVQFLVNGKGAEPEMIKLREVLSPFGFEVQLKTDRCYPGADEVQLKIKWDKKTIHRRRTRNAGASFADRSISWEQIDGWRGEGMTSADIAKKLHVSRATYYNHLKLREQQPDYLYF